MKQVALCYLGCCVGYTRLIIAIRDWSSADSVKIPMFASFLCLILAPPFDKGLHPPLCRRCMASSACVLVCVTKKVRPLFATHSSHDVLALVAGMMSPSEKGAHRFQQVKSANCRGQFWRESRQKAASVWLGFCAHVEVGTFP